MEKLKYHPKFHKYKVSKTGEVWSYHNPNNVKKITNVVMKTGYVVTNIHDKSLKKGGSMISVAQLVLETWGMPRPSLEYKVHFKDGNRQNLNFENLEWKTQAEICRLNINKIKGDMARRPKRRIILIMDGLADAENLFGWQVTYYLNTGRKTKNGFYSFDVEGYEKWKKLGHIEK